MDKNKRQLYIWDENMPLWNSLNNKSKLVNLLLRKYRQENEIDGDDAADE